MIDTTERPCLQYRIGGLLIVELPSLAFERSWVTFPEMDMIGILRDLSEQERRSALSEALAEMVAGTD